MQPFNIQYTIVNSENHSFDATDTGPDHMHTTLITILYIFVKESFVLICEGDPQRNLADHV